MIVKLSLGAAVRLSSTKRKDDTMPSTSDQLSGKLHIAAKLGLSHSDLNTFVAQSALDRDLKKKDWYHLAMGRPVSRLSSDDLSALEDALDGYLMTVAVMSPELGLN